jgi:hypothetical protein
MLQLVRAVIHNVTCLEPQPRQSGVAGGGGAGTSAAGAVQGDSAVTNVQDQVTDAGLLLPVAAMLDARNHVLREALATMGEVMEGGNSHGQAVFAEYFFGSRNDRFFTDCKALIDLASESLADNRVLRNSKVTSDATLKRWRGTMKGSLTTKAAGQALTLLAKGVDVGSPAEALVQLKTQGHFDLVLKLLGLMCEGNARAIQDYLRDQPDNFKKVNLVALCTDAFGVLVQQETHENLPILIQALDTLTEHVVPKFTSDTHIRD